jgi:hypothetical protein
MRLQKPQGLMVWAAINGRGQLILKRCPPKVKARDYQNILKSAKLFIKPRYKIHTKFVDPDSLFLIRRSGIRFQQDGAPVHKARSTTSWLKTEGVRMFNGGIWPASSPDMNLMEHIWPMVSHKLVGQVFPDRDTLWSALQVAFAEITPTQIGRLYASMPNRLQALYQARGGHTRY